MKLAERRRAAAVVSIWSVEAAEPRRSRHLWRASPHVSALLAYQDRTPRAGVASCTRRS